MQLLLFFFTIIFSTLALGSQTSFSGKAYNEKGEHIFTEEYVVTKDDQTVKDVTTKFFDPEGKLIAEMCSIFEKEDFLPKVKFQKKRLSFEYGTLLLEKSIELFKSTTKRPFTSKKLSIENNMVVGHGFYFYILSKIDALLSGNMEKMIFLQPDRLSSYTFSMKAKEKEDDNEVVYVTLSLDNKLLKAFVSDIKLAIHRPSQQILSYEGISGFLPQSKAAKKISIKYSFQPEL